MTKRLLIFTLSALMLAPVTILKAANAPFETVQQDMDDEVTISVNGTSVSIDSPAQRIDLNVPKGCYILKVGKVVRKVSLR